MAFFNGTGPKGEGPGTGRGMGNCKSTDKRQERTEDCGRGRGERPRGCGKGRCQGGRARRASR